MMSRRGSGRTELGGSVCLRWMGGQDGLGEGSSRRREGLVLVLPNTRGITKSWSGCNVWVLVFMISRLDCTGRRHRRGGLRPPDDMVVVKLGNGDRTVTKLQTGAGWPSQETERVRRVKRYTWTTRRFHVLDQAGFELSLWYGFATYPLGG